MSIPQSIMHKKQVISYLRSEAEQVLQACVLMKSSSQSAVELFCPAELIPLLQDIGHGHCIKPIESFCGSESGQLFFSGMASYQSYCAANKAKALTLYLHRELAILEVSGNYLLPDSFGEKGLKACLIKGDPAQKMLSASQKILCFTSLNEFFSNKQPNDVLITANHPLIEALIMQDSDSWQLFHPLFAAQNLGLDIFDQQAVNSTLEKALYHTQVPDLQTNDCFDLAARRQTIILEDEAYSFFAEHYDDYMSHVDYELWVSKLLGWQDQYGLKPLTKVLELACGTANISTRLVFRGLQVDACDLSVSMLSVAGKKALKPNLYQASLTDPIPGKAYQLVLCMFDSVNYLIKQAQVVKMLKEVSLALQDGGLFIFDISTLGNSLDNFSELCNLQRTQDGYLLHQAWFEVLQLKQRSRLHYFQRRGLGYSLLQEQHTQRVYYCHELIELISKSPFKLVAIHSTQLKSNLYPRQLQGIDEKYHRLFFVLKKEAT